MATRAVRCLMADISASARGALAMGSDGMPVLFGAVSVLRNPWLASPRAGPTLARGYLLRPGMATVRGRGVFPRRTSARAPGAPYARAGGVLLPGRGPGKGDPPGAAAV